MTRRRKCLMWVWAAVLCTGWVVLSAEGVNLSRCDTNQADSKMTVHAVHQFHCAIMEKSAQEKSAMRLASSKKWNVDKDLRKKCRDEGVLCKLPSNMSVETTQSVCVGTLGGEIIESPGLQPACNSCELQIPKMKILVGTRYQCEQILGGKSLGRVFRLNKTGHPLA